MKEKPVVEMKFGCEKVFFSHFAHYVDA